MAKWNMRLSTTEPNNPVGLIKVRQSNKETEILSVTVIENQTFKNLKGMIVYFNTVFGLNPVQKKARLIDPGNGKIEFILDDDCMQEIGTQEGYFSFENEKGEFLGSTQNFTYRVQSSLLRAIVDGGVYLQSVEDLLKQLQEYIDSGQGSFDDWWESIKGTLDEDAAGSLALAINDLKGSFNETLNRLLVQFGRLQFPEPFNLKFDVDKIDRRHYSHNATPTRVHNWTKATEIFINSRNTLTGLGTNQRQPVTFGRFAANYKTGLYGSQKDFILTVDTDVYDVYNALALSGMDCNLYIRSGGFSGKTWFGNFFHSYTETSTISSWTKVGNVYKTSLVAAGEILDILNINDLDNNGIPRVFNVVNSKDECNGYEGTFFQEGQDIYVHPYLNQSIEDCMLQNKVASPFINTTGWNGKVICLENLGFPTATNIFNFNAFQEFYVFNSHFYRGEQDAFSVTGKFKCFILNSIGAYSSKDAFNYHSSSPDSVGIEINCKGYGAGQYKLKTVNSNAEKTSNNGSTAHDSMNILRVGSKYYNCEGPVVADVNGCLSISLGCEVGEVLATTDGIKAAFHMNNFSAIVNKKQYILECFGNGENVTWGIHGTNYTYFSDIEGNLKRFGAVNEINPREVLPL